MPGPNSITSVSPTINCKIPDLPKSDNTLTCPSVDDLKRFVGSQPVKHTASTVAWIGVGLTIAGIVLAATGVGVVAGTILIAAGCTTILLATAAYEVSLACSHPNHNYGVFINRLDGPTVFNFSYKLNKSGDSRIRMDDDAYIGTLADQIIDIYNIFSSDKSTKPYKDLSSPGNKRLIDSSDDSDSLYEPWDSGTEYSSDQESDKL